jgi:hypothetical protein
VTISTRTATKAGQAADGIGKEVFNGSSSRWNYRCRLLYLNSCCFLPSV